MISTCLLLFFCVSLHSVCRNIYIKKAMITFLVVLVQPILFCQVRTMAKHLCPSESACVHMNDSECAPPQPVEYGTLMLTEVYG